MVQSSRCECPPGVIQLDVEKTMSDLSSAMLPSSYEGLRSLQKEFDRYQEAAFPQRSTSFFSLELCGEAGELANLEKKAWRGQQQDAAAFEDEAADVVIAILNYANTRGVDLAREVERKMKVIESRRMPSRHTP